MISRSVRDPVQPRLGPKPFRSRPDQGTYDSGVETRDEPRKQPPPPSDEENDGETEVFFRFLTPFFSSSKTF